MPIFVAASSIVAVDAKVRRMCSASISSRVNGLPADDGLAHRARAARIGSGAFFAAQGFGEDAGGAGFADAACPGEKKSVVDAFERNGVGQRAGDVFLTCQIGKTLGTILTSKDQIRHLGIMGNQLGVVKARR